MLQFTTTTTMEKDQSYGKAACITPGGLELYKMPMGLYKSLWSRCVLYTKGVAHEALCSMEGLYTKHFFEKNLWFISVST